MKRLLLGMLLAPFALPALAALQPGDNAPQFTTQAALGGKEFRFSLKDALKKGPVVVYFYPSAYTGGCDIEAHTFAEDSAKFAAAGVTIIGVSLDSIARLDDFSADPKYCAGKFPTASDATGAITKSYGLQIHPGRKGLKDVRGVEIGHGFAERTTFVIAPDGRIARTIGGVAPADNVAKTLEAVRQLRATRGTAPGA